MITERTTGGRQALSKMISNITNGTWKPLLLKFSSAQYRTPEGQSDQNPKNPHRSKSHPKGNQLEPGRWVNDSKSKANNECKLPKVVRHLAPRMQNWNLKSHNWNSIARRWRITERSHQCMIETCASSNICSSINALKIESLGGQKFQIIIFGAKPLGF